MTKKQFNWCSLAVYGLILGLIQAEVFLPETGLLIAMMAAVLHACLLIRAHQIKAPNDHSEDKAAGPKYGNHRYVNTGKRLRHTVQQELRKNKTIRK